MKNPFLLFAFLVSTLVSFSQNLPPEINNFNIVDNGDLSVTITYDLLDNEGEDCLVSLQVIDENGNSFLVQNNGEGDINTLVTVGNGKSITWNYNNDLDASGNYIFKLVADDLYEIDIQELVDQVDSTLLHTDLEFIQGIRHRDTGLDHLEEVRDMITSRMESFGYSPETQAFNYSNFTGENYIANDLGTESQDEVYILCGHYDTVFNSPGADDNGSAIAGMLEAMRLLSPYRFKKTVRFIAFDLEEPGLKGSIDYVTNGVPSSDEISGVLDFEMIGYFTEEPNSQSLPFGFNSLFPDAYAQVQTDEFRGNFIANVGKVDQNSWELAFQNAASTYVPNLKVVTIIAPSNWETITPDLGRSDHAPFWVADNPAVMLSGTANFRNQNYHTPNDTIETLNFTFMADVVKAAVATLAEEAEIQHSGIAVGSIDLMVNMVEENSIDDIHFYPNPVQNTLNIESSIKIDKIELIATDGKVVLTINNPKNTIDISSIAKGIYTVRVNSNKARFPRLIVQ